MKKTSLSLLQSKIGIKFNDQQKVLQSLVHRSYLNENKEQKIESNERYEFLGDAVLELWISDNLFRMFPNFQEGDLTNLRSLVVCTQNLSLVATNIDLGKFVVLSKGEEIHGGRKNQSILADTFEALIGAIYLDQGYQGVDQFLSQFLSPSIKELSSKDGFKDPKSVFQEIAQAKKGITPHYKTLKEIGPDHKKTFKVGVYLENELVATGSGTSKQKAEEEASIKATKLFSNLV